jgi:hypothetical protein
MRLWFSCGDWSEEICKDVQALSLHLSVAMLFRKKETANLRAKDRKGKAKRC